MSAFQKKSFQTPDENRTAPYMKMEIVKFGERPIVRMTCEPGWRWSEHMRPMVGTDSCQGTHFSYVLAGHFRTLMDDGTVMDIGPGDVAITPPGHDAWVIGNEPCVLLDFQGASQAS